MDTNWCASRRPVKYERCYYYNELSKVWSPYVAPHTRTHTQGVDVVGIGFACCCWRQTFPFLPVFCTTRLLSRRRRRLDALFFLPPPLDSVEWLVGLWRLRRRRRRRRWSNRQLGMIAGLLLLLRRRTTGLFPLSSHSLILPYPTFYTINRLLLMLLLVRVVRRTKRCCRKCEHLM